MSIKSALKKADMRLTDLDAIAQEYDFSRPECLILHFTSWRIIPKLSWIEYKPSMPLCMRSSRHSQATLSPIVLVTVMNGAPERSCKQVTRVSGPYLLTPRIHGNKFKFLIDYVTFQRLSNRGQK